MRLLLAVEVLRLLHAVLLAPGLAHHRHHQQLLGQHRVGGVELEVDGQRVDLLHRPDALEREGALRGGPLRPLDREDGVVGGERAAVVEGDAGAQREAPGGRPGHLPAGGQRGFELEVCVAVEQGVVDLQGHPRVVQQGHRMRVHGLRVEGAGHAQHAGRGRRGRRRQGLHQCQRRQQQCQRAPGGVAARRAGGGEGRWHGSGNRATGAGGARQAHRWIVACQGASIGASAGAVGALLRLADADGHACRPAVAAPPVALVGATGPGQLARRCPGRLAGRTAGAAAGHRLCRVGRPAAGHGPGGRGAAVCGGGAGRLQPACGVGPDQCHVAGAGGDAGVAGGR